NSLPTRASWVKSLIRALPAPGYWILTATRLPSFQTARCTWPIEAAAAGVSSNEANSARQSSPRSAASTRCTVLAGSGGADSRSLVSVARYGSAGLGGGAPPPIGQGRPD